MLKNNIQSSTNLSTDIALLATITEKEISRTGIEVKSNKIDDLIPEEILHKFDPELVLTYAVGRGFIRNMCSYKDKIRANGIWISTNKYPGISDSNENTSHGYCPDCYNMAIKEIESMSNIYNN